MVKCGEVVVVSGPPGAGKTTIAAVLASEAELGVHLESDWFYRSIRAGFVPPYLKEAHSQNTAVIDAATEAAAAYAAAGYTVVWDGVLGPWFVDRVARRLAGHGIKTRYLVLRCDPATALERVSERDGDTEASGAAVMLAQFEDLAEFEANVVDSGAAADVVVERCRQALAGDALVVNRDGWVDDRWPVSVKGVLGWDGRFVVLQNRRGEWELPGGRLDATDVDPPSALRREMLEELDIDVTVGELIDSWIYDIEGRRVLILTYRCEADRPAVLRHSDEHTDVAALALDELTSEPFPDAYLGSIARAARASANASSQD